LLTHSLILIVANISGQSEVLFDYLVGFGFRVLVANDGESGLAIAEDTQPDIILLEVILPGIDGFEACRRLKENEATRHIPVIFITALANTVDKVRGLALGAVDYITKPIQSEELLARVRTHLTIQSLQNELKEKNTRLEQEIVEREKLIAELDAFAHTVAHDLKNPMNVTITHAQFLLNYGLKLAPQEWQKYAKVIMQNGRKMSNIINELLLLASVRTEEVELEPLENMADIVDEVQGRLAYTIEEYQAEITSPPHWPTALGYGPWVEEVWTNYLSNALKYGGRPPRIELGATAQNDRMVQFWVRDNGAGITPEAQRQLFVPFARLNQVRIEGHGLGLSIVQRIVEKLGGRVAVESAGIPGQGSLFSFYLPLYEGSYQSYDLSPIMNQ
jgi:signal transduction histidine kinase